MEKATEVLKHDHRVIERVLAVLERVAEAPQEASWATWGKVIDFIRNFADKCHHLKEEKLLFPALQRHGIPCEGGPIGVMLVEHEEGRGYLRLMTLALELAEEVPEAAKATLVQNARSYLRLLRGHIRKEEEVLFEMADEVLTQEEQNKLAREFEEHEAQEIGAGIHDKYLRIAQELEDATSRIAKRAGDDSCSRQ
ncbi:MAG: hemerythrin domain-containing protein [Nitrospiria bacterium]